MPNMRSIDRVIFSITLEVELVAKLKKIQKDLDTKNRNDTIELLLKRATERVKLDDNDMEWVYSVIEQNRIKRDKLR